MTDFAPTSNDNRRIAAVSAHAAEVGRYLGQALAAIEPQAGGADAAGARAGEVDRQVARCLSDALRSLAESGCVGPGNRLPSSRFWQACDTSMALGSLQKHAREKPLGYPGDFQLLDRICTHDVRGTGLAGALDRYFQNQAAPAAVRNRGRENADTIVRVAAERPGVPLRICIVGAGPAWEVVWALEADPSLPSRCHFTLIDLDPRAVAFVDARLADRLPPEQRTCLQANLKRLPRLTRLAAHVSDSDLILCPGYFDYLEGPTAASMLRWMWEQLRPGGELLVFNFSVENPSRAYMEWVGNWYLEYRTPTDLEVLAQALPPAANVSLGAEAAGVNLYMRAQHRR